jgi:DNA-binding MarR family transcriptional regulator
MRTIHEERSSGHGLEAEVRRFQELMMDLGRRRPMRDPLSAMCEEGQLTPPQVHAVVWLGRDGLLTMGELARLVGITEKTITGLVDRLEEAGYLERVRDQGDRRVVRARLTPKGEGAYRELDGHLREKLTRLLGLLDAADRKALYRIVEKLSHRLEAEAAAPETKKP